MIRYLFPLALLATPAAAQDRAPPPAFAAPEASSVQAVLAPIYTLFAALEAHDPEMIRPLLIDGATITVADALPDGSRRVHRLPFADWASRLSGATQQYRETMPNPAVEIDGDVALVWGFYTFTVDGRFNHCGVNHFSMVRQDGEWKVADLAFSTRTTDCGN